MAQFCVYGAVLRFWLIHTDCHLLLKAGSTNRGYGYANRRPLSLVLLCVKVVKFRFLRGLGVSNSLCDDELKVAVADNEDF